MLEGATSKRFHFFLSAFCRFVVFWGLIVAFVVVKIVVKPEIRWLNILLMVLAIANLATSIFNLVLCGFSANQYHNNFAPQLICFLICMFTGGIITTTFTGVATFTKVLPDEMKNEKIFNTKTFKINGGKNEKETKN